MREIKSNEVQRLRECVEALSEYHNTVSTHFKGMFPSRPYETTLELFKTALDENTSHIAIIEDNDLIVGFCKVDISDSKGKLDYLVVLENYRGKGYGKQLMEWAMQVFHKYSVTQIEIKVIDGNDAIHLYEKYGFKQQAQILMLKPLEKNQ